MKRVNVIGTSGSGKTTFSRRLAEQLGIAHIEIDNFNWEPNWVEKPEELFQRDLQQALQADSWVLDGGYSRINDIKWKNVDTVIWIDYSLARTFFQLFIRTIQRAITREALWDSKNRESFYMSFMTKDSIFIWMLKTYFSNKKKNAAFMESPEYKHIDFIRLRSPREVDKFLKSQSL